MKFNKHEELVREQRTVEAMRKGFMGIDGKFSLIARTLGEPIWLQGGSLYEQNCLDDPWALEGEEEELPVMDEEEVSHQIGWIFDGCRHGYNIVVRFMEDLRDLRVEHDGVLVYHELAGQLEAYAPTFEWEKKIDVLFTLTKKRERNMRTVREEDRKAVAEKKKDEFLHRLRDKWGL